MLADEAASEPLTQGFWDVLKRPRTRWDRITRAAWVFAVFYMVLVFVTQVPLKIEWPNWVRDFSNAGFGVALMIISIWYGGILTDFYSKLTGFGISNVRVNRQGQKPEYTQMWIRRIAGSKEIIIVGTLSKGWFMQAKDELDELLANSKETKLLCICLLDPFGNVWRSMVESGQQSHDRFLLDIVNVFGNVSELAENHKEIVVQLYDTEPISCVVAKGTIYLGLYLPRTARKEIPEFTISRGSFLGEKVYAESVEKLRASAPVVSPETLKYYTTTMKKHFTTTREAFWTDPQIFCDFCKEPRGLPSEISRRYPSFIDSSRIAAKGQHFFVIPSLGQLADDHSLIVSHKHITSSAQFDELALAELTEFFGRLQAAAAKEQKAQLFFEHGVPCDGAAFGGCGICHCHIHSVPLQADYDAFNGLDEFLTQRNCKYRKHNLGEWKEIRKYSDASYLCVQAEGRAKGVVGFIFEGRVASQLMRQFIEQRWPNPRRETSTETWDWRRTKDEEAQLKASSGRLKKLFT